MVYAPDESPSQPQQDPPNSMVFYGSAVAIVVFSTFTSILSDPNHNALAFKRIPWAAISGVLTRDIFAQPAFNSSRGEELSPGKEVQSDEEYR